MNSRVHSSYGGRYSYPIWKESLRSPLTFFTEDVEDVLLALHDSWQFLGSDGLLVDLRRVILKALSTPLIKGLASRPISLLVLLSSIKGLLVSTHPFVFHLRLILNNSSGLLHLFWVLSGQAGPLFMHVSLVIVTICNRILPCGLGRNSFIFNNNNYYKLKCYVLICKWSSLCKSLSHLDPSDHTPSLPIGKPLDTKGL